MHRSGTSALAGTLAELGVDFGDASRSNRFQPKGNVENAKLTRLHERILRRCGGAWWDPPDCAAIQVQTRQRTRLIEILGRYEGEVIGVKDPRLLLLLAELWEGLPLARIGTLRNPAAVIRSLQARARALGEPQELKDAAVCERLWCRYNRLLLEEHERELFPLLDFDRPADFAEGARDALRSYGLAADSATRFFEPALMTSPGDAWREEMSAETLALYDELASRSVGSTAEGTSSIGARRSSARPS